MASRVVAETVAGVGLGLGAYALIREVASRRSSTEPGDGDDAAEDGSGAVTNGGSRPSEEQPPNQSATPSNALRASTRSDATARGQVSRGGRYRRHRTQW
jgi:hypothetical protein